MPKKKELKESSKAEVKASPPPPDTDCEELSLDDMTTIDDGTSKLESQIKGGDINGEIDDAEDEILND